MNISFSTKGWQGTGWETFINTASEIGFTGIELHDTDAISVNEKNGQIGRAHV